MGVNASTGLLAEHGVFELAPLPIYSDNLALRAKTRAKSS